MWPEYSRNSILHVYRRGKISCGGHFTLKYEKCESSAPCNAPSFWRSIVFLEGFQASLSFPSGRAACLWMWVCSLNGMILIGKSTQRKPCPSATFQPQIYGLARDRTRASTFKVGRLTAWIMAQPLKHKVHINNVPSSCVSNPDTNLSVPFKKIIAVCFKNHAIHINKLYGQSADFLDSKVCTITVVM